MVIHPPLSPQFPIGTDGFSVRAHRDPPPGRGALAASLCPERFKSIFLYWERERDRGRERKGGRGTQRGRESARTGSRAAREKAERRTEYRHKLHSWLEFGSRQLFLFVGFLRLSRRLGYTLQMKVRLLGEKKCPGLQTSSPVRVRAAEPPRLRHHQEFLVGERCHLTIIGGFI